MEPPNKRQKKVLFADSGSEDEDAGVAIGDDFKLNVNKEYARRFEYNKRREEMVQLENKLGKRPLANGKASADDEDEEESDSEDSEEEDDAAELVTEALDEEIAATLKAIRSKDPKVYDPNAKFYTVLDDIENAEGAKSEPEKGEKPMFLKDYHRQNLLSGQGAVDEDDDDAPKTYAQEQEDLKRSIVKEMHSTAENGEQDGGEDDEEFLVRKEKAPVSKSDRPTITEKDVAVADQDPETFLSNFMASRAWVPTTKSSFQPLESDDEEEDKRAEQFEEAYNLRFEDPNKLNEVIRTHARDTTSKYSVRREEVSGRKRQRELERQRKEAEKKQREEERARLRKLKIEELEDKLAKIKKAAGVKSSEFADEDWSRFLDEGWDDEKWEKEMKQRFGEEYYAANEEDDESDDGAGASSSKKRKLKKPKWDDDIDIDDLVPDFDEELDVNMDIDDVEGEDDEAEGEDDHSGGKKSKKQMLKDKKEKQKEAKRERRKIEALADKSLELEPSLLPGSSKKFGGTFRYRESSPVSFGLTARDILMADDSQLNQYAGLKKLASFRDAEKKKRDHKRLGKKARLREWRKETFGTEEPPELTAEPVPTGEADGETKVDIREGSSKRRKRSRKH